jgi:hypothetical protein
MASRQRHERSRSRYHDDSYDKTRRSRNDSTYVQSHHCQNMSRILTQSTRLDPTTYHDSKHQFLQHPSSSSRRNHSRTCRRWPPQPTVEEEKDSLRRELNPDPADNDHIPARGSLEQEPILIDVPGYTPDRRFVWVPSTKKSPETHSTPPTSDDERARRREKRKGPRVETIGLPEMQREASPYAWSKPTPSSRTFAKHDQGTFLFPDAITPPAASRPSTSDRQLPTSVPRPDWSDLSRRPQKPPTRDGSPLRSTSQHVYEGRSTAEGTRSADEYMQQRPSTRYSWTKQEQPHSSPATPFSPATSEPWTKRPSSFESHSGSEEYSRKPAPSQIVNLQQSERPASSYPHYSSETSHNHHNKSPPSRTSSSDRLRDAYPPSIPNSRPSSRGGSAQCSPQPSPRIQHPPEYPWNMGSAASSAARRAQPPSRLAELPRSPYPQAQKRGSSGQYSPLPYPDDDRSYETMPSERDHQYFPEQSSGLLPPFNDPVSRANTPRQSSTSGRVPAAEERSATSGASRNSRPKSADLTATVRKVRLDKLPGCRREVYTTDYKDWYTLEASPDFGVCPRCFNSVFDGTQFSTCFRPLPSRAANTARKCEFSSPWIRLAWILTTNNRLDNLSMLISIFTIGETEQPCPGLVRGVRDWYSLRDRDGHFIREFTVCPSDVSRLGVLLPAFKSLLVPLPCRYDDDFDALDRHCSLRPHNNSRFEVYIDCLFKLHEAGVLAGRMPDPYDFVSLVKRKTRYPECLRDDKVERADWYYIPSLAPALTVCEECYNDVVWPWVRSNSDVAMRFNRTAQPVRGEGRGGVSCQLYSRRMREVFQYAVQKNDMKYLARKAKDRKDVEEDFQQQCSELREDAEELKGRSGYAISSKAEQELVKLQYRVEAIGEEWREKWE